MRTMKKCAVPLTGLMSVTGAVLAVVMIATTASAGQATKSVQTGKSRLAIALTKPTAAKAGDNDFEVVVKDRAGKPVTDAEVSVLFVMPAMPAMKMAEMRHEVKLTSAGNGKYTGNGQVMMRGKWNVTVSVKKNGKLLGERKLAVTAKS